MAPNQNLVVAYSNLEKCSNLASVWGNTCRPLLYLIGGMAMLKRDTSAKLLEIHGFLGRLKGCRLTSGNVYWEIPWNEAQYRAEMAKQHETPVCLAGSGSKKWWLFRGLIYLEDEQYEAKLPFAVDILVPFLNCFFCVDLRRVG